MTILAWLAGGGAAAAEPNCVCRANGTDYRLNEEVCILSAGIPYRARCVMVLNNTSWQRIGPCEQARNPASPKPATALSTAAEPKGLVAFPLQPPASMCEPARWSGKAAERPGS